MNPSSYENVEEKWAPEIKHYRPKTPFILVGTQIDLKDSYSDLQRLRKDRLKPVSTEQGVKLASRLGADCYVECSALTQTGLKTVFDAAILAVLEPKQRLKKPHKCTIL